MPATEWCSTSPGRPVPSLQPYVLSAHLNSFGVEHRVVGSAASGERARDLDVVISRRAENLDRLESALKPIAALSSTSRMIQRLRCGDTALPFTVGTSLGPLDIHGWDL